MEIINKSRKTGLTLAQCTYMLPILKSGKSVFIATNKYPTNIIAILSNLGVVVIAEEQYTQPNLELMYDFEGIIGFKRPTKKLTGYKLTLK